MYDLYLFRWQGSQAELLEPIATQTPHQRMILIQTLCMDCSYSDQKCNQNILDLKVVVSVPKEKKITCKKIDLDQSQWQALYLFHKGQLRWLVKKKYRKVYVALCDSFYA